MARRVSDTDLLRWLDDEPERLERYLERNPDDADRVDRLTSLAPAVHDGLNALLAPPPDLPERVHQWFTPDPLVRETAEMLYDLLGLAWRTTRTLFTEPQDPDA